LTPSGPSSVEPLTTAARKADHIRINVEENVSGKGITTGFERYRFTHEALPEIDLDDVSTATNLFGRDLQAPLLISCMTGGVPEAEQINCTLAEAAQERGLALGLGSARILLESPQVLPSFAVRRYAPDVPLLANLGAVQLNKGVTVEDCRRIVDLLEADALVLHLNPLQEALQLEGDTNFGGLLKRIEALCADLDVPVVAKEIGWGINRDLVRKLFDAGVAAVDVAGAGGTSWSEVERHRLGSPVRAAIAAAFADWGIPTADLIRDARRVAPSGTLFASGGIRNGVEVAKALALGADMVGVAGPFLRAAVAGRRRVLDLADELVGALKMAMFLTGSTDLPALRLGNRIIDATGPRPEIVRGALHYTSSRAPDFIDITDDIQDMVRGAGIQEGLVHIASTHTTAAIRVNENEPLLIEDFSRLLERLAPNGHYHHNELERRKGIAPDEPQNGHAHCRHLLLGHSETVTIQGGRLDLGVWQRIFLIELDSPRSRQVKVQVMGR